MKKIKTFVISIASSHERQQSIKSQFDALNLDFDFSNATTPETLPEWFQNKIDDRKTIQKRGYVLGGGEKGCYCSHYLLWKKCVELNVPIIIIEDDSVIGGDNFLQFLKLDHDNFDYVKLEIRSRRKITGKINEYIYLPSRADRVGTSGYYLTPKAALNFIKASESIYMPVDNFIGAIWLHRILPWGLVHPAVCHNKEEFGTNIQDVRANIKAKAIKNDSLIIRLSRRISKSKDKIKFIATLFFLKREAKNK